MKLGFYAYERMITMDINIYHKMRLWENSTNLLKERKKELYDYSRGETKILFEDPFQLEDITLEKRIETVNEEIEFYRKKRREIELELNSKGIDVEYIVTSVYPDLKFGGWLHNYYIKESKIQNEGHKYTIQEGNDKFSATFHNLQDAVREVLSYYNYLSNSESFDEIMEKMSYFFEVRK